MTNHNGILITAIIMLIFGTLVCIEHIKPRKADPVKIGIIWVIIIIVVDYLLT